ncbi:MAG: DUF1294 domain-containing protein [Firmicutes bacterium]|nr:DUF1294 domain-containing protein [Bacillota bacterium]
MITGVVLGWDKWQSTRGGPRIAEVSLLVLAVLGGSAGALLAMYVFRHKNRHRRFSWGLPIILVLQLVIFYCTVKG